MFDLHRGAGSGEVAVNANAKEAETATKSERIQNMQKKSNPGNATHSVWKTGVYMTCAYLTHGVRLPCVGSPSRTAFF